MGPIGFSTGTLTKGDFRLGMRMLKEHKAAAIELSALREDELDSLLQEIDDIDVSSFAYVSFHAPSALVNLQESDLIAKLAVVASKGWPIIVHPDIISEWDKWNRFGNLLCIENMDKRKRCGRTADELQVVFDRLPNAGFCFDIAHARQIDPSMCEAAKILSCFSGRIKQIHLSEISASSVHEPLSSEALRAFQKINARLPVVPMILESPVTWEKMESEMDKVRQFLDKLIPQ